MPYSPATDDDRRAMLDVIGVEHVDALYEDVPLAARSTAPLNLPDGVGELRLRQLAAEHIHNTIDLSRIPSFLGAGSYDHFVPAVVRSITSRSEFATAYTPYQPELSQGTLQSIFEFQSSIAALTGLEVSNASLYDGATAAAEAMCLAEQTTRRSRVVVLGSVAPHIRDVVRTYAHGYGVDVEEIPVDLQIGSVNVDAVDAALTDDVAALIVQQPNAFGMLEAADELVQCALRVGAVPVVHADPISLGVLEAPGAYGAQVVVGDGQPLGQAPSFGGPSFGFLSASQQLLRRLPGRIVGESVDLNGTRAYTLTMQTREQHIRREKATSNICTNQALCALGGLVYLSWLGPRGLQSLASDIFERTQALETALARVPGVRVMHRGPKFRELLLDLDAPARDVVDRCLMDGVLAGWPAAQGWHGLGDGALLVAITEQRTPEDIELLCTSLERNIREVSR